MKVFCSIIILLIHTIGLFANGGSISDGSFVRGNSSITLLKEKDIKLNSEYLNLHVQGDYINVNVIYELENIGEAKTIKYGFAVDYRDNPSNEILWKDEYIKNFTIINNSTSLQTYTKVEKNVRIEQCDYSLWDSAPPEDSISRKWYISDLAFTQGETKQLIVTYQIKANYADWGRQSDGGSYYPAHMSNRLFRYYLKPSGFWGNGTVGDFKLNISFDNIDKYSHCKITGIDTFNTVANSYVFEATNFSLLANEYLKLDYNYSKWLSTHEALSFNNSEDLLRNIKCSSPNPKYPVANLVDKNKNTAYVPLGTQKGSDWIEIEFNDNVKIYGIGLINGYTKSKTTYFNNNIVTKLELTIKYKYNTYNRTISLTRKDLSGDYASFFVGIEDIIFGDLIYSLYDDLSAFSDPISLRIDILEQDKGEKYDDTCLSELMIYGEKE